MNDAAPNNKRTTAVAQNALGNTMTNVSQLVVCLKFPPGSPVDDCTMLLYTYIDINLVKILWAQWCNANTIELNPKSMKLSRFKSWLGHFFFKYL